MKSKVFLPLLFLVAIVGLPAFPAFSGGHETLVVTPAEHLKPAASSPDTVAFGVTAGSRIGCESAGGGIGTVWRRDPRRQTDPALAPYRFLKGSKARTGRALRAKELGRDEN